MLNPRTASNISFATAYKLQLPDFHPFGGLPVPLEPSTTDLTQVPFDPTPTSPGRKWHRLEGSSSRPPRQGDIYTPDPPTPPSRQLRNDTPTPAETTPGSWRGKRRVGEHVDRPPALRLKELRSSDSMRMGIGQSHLDISPSEFLAHSHSTTDSSYVTADDIQASAPSGSKGSQDHQDTPQPKGSTQAQSPQTAKLAPPQDQLDGASEDDETRHNQYRRSCSEFCKGSLRGISKRFTGLFKKERSSQDDKQVPTVTAKSVMEANAEVEREGLWASSLKRFKKTKPQGRKPIPSFDGHVSPNRSGRHLLSGSDNSNRTSHESTSTGPQEVNRPNGPSAPQASRTQDELPPSSVETVVHVGGGSRVHEPSTVNGDAGHANSSSHRGSGSSSGRSSDSNKKGTRSMVIPLRS
ncbi:MAG: hypothetical protein Q9218_004086 [Villophora microphyllina]